jgi:anti-anti-sigma regulatory factor
MNTARDAGLTSMTTGEEGETRHIFLHGEHDMTTTATLTRQTAGLGPTCTNVVVDLTDVTFIDSSLICWLLQRRTTDLWRGRTVDIVTGPPESAPSRLFSLLGLDALTTSTGSPIVMTAS